jgi:hypothetical protein
MVSSPRGRFSMKPRGSLPDLLVAGIRPAVPDVLQQGAVQHGGVLRHHGNGVAQAVIGDARNVEPVDQDAAGVDRIEALHQGDEGRLAAA